MNSKNFSLLKYFKSNYFIIDNLAHITFLFLILTLLFIFLISKTEEKSLIKEVNKELKNVNFKDINLDKIEYKEHEDKIKKLVKTKMNFNKKKNNLLIFILLIINIFMMIILTITIYYNNKYSNFTFKKIKHLFLDLLFIFIIIGIIETLFFFNVGLNYNPVTIKYIVSELNQTLTK